MDVNKKELSSLLSEYMSAAQISDAALHSRIQEHFPQMFWVSSEINIRRWRTGQIKSVRNWRQLIGVAAGLGLDKDQTEELLDSAGLPTFEQVRLLANEEERAFLSHYWEESTSRSEIAALMESIRSLEL